MRETARSCLRERFPWERLYALERGEASLATSDVRWLAGLGWLGLLVPVELGGGGASLMEAGVLIEELGYAAVPAPLRQHSIAAWVLSQAPQTSATRDRLSEMAGGQRLYTALELLPAPAAGAPAALSLKDGALSGLLPQVAFADLADFVLAPLTAGGEPALAATSLTGTRLQQVKLLDHPHHFDVHIDNVGGEHLSLLATGPAAARLGDQHTALVSAFSLLQAAGMMRRILGLTTGYISQRNVYGRPIAAFQAARHHAADLLMLAETTRWTAYDALWRFQAQGDAHAIWLARHWALRAGERICQLAHLLHGGTGVDMSYPLHLYTQGLMALGARGGTMDEMVSRGSAAIGLQTGAGDAKAWQP